MPARPAILLLVLSVAIGPARADADRALATLTARSDGLVTAVSGTVRGHRLWFDLDTGATHSIVDQSAARRIGLAALGAGRLRGAGAGSVPIVRLKPLSIRIGVLSFVPRDPLSVDLSNSGSAIAEGGILGFDFYRSFVVDNNYDARRVTLYDPVRYVYRGKGTRVRLILRPPRAYVSVVVAARGVPPETHLLRLDTGSSDAVDDDIVLRSDAPKKNITAGVGIGSRFKAYLGNVTELRVGPFVLHDLPSATGGVQLIGDTVWRKFNIVFDFSRSVMYLTPRS
jgi:hypothetical protein